MYICNIKKIEDPLQNRFGTLSQKTGLKRIYFRCIRTGQCIRGLKYSCRTLKAVPARYSSHTSIGSITLAHPPTLEEIW